MKKVLNLMITYYCKYNTKSKCNTVMASGSKLPSSP